MTITETMIPEEVVEAAAMPIYIAWEGPGDSHIFERQLRQWGRAKDAARAAILAALNAWPGMKAGKSAAYYSIPDRLILPLPAAGGGEAKQETPVYQEGRSPGEWCGEGEP